MTLLFKNDTRPHVAKFVSRDPFAMMQRLVNDYVTDSLLQPWSGHAEPKGARAAFSPDIELKEKDDRLTLSAELPGLTDKDVTITLERDSICLEGEKKSEKTEEKDGRTYCERSFGFFRREIPLPFEVDQEKVKAEFKNGLLKVELMKAPSAKTTSRKIAIG